MGEKEYIGTPEYYEEKCNSLEDENSMLYDENDSLKDEIRQKDELILKLQRKGY